MELCWPYNRHYMINSGIVDYATEHTDWQLDHCDYPEVFMDQGLKYDGIVGRISKGGFEKANELGVPVVNLWMNSPVSAFLPTVLVDHIEAGRLATEHLIARGFKRIVMIGYKKDCSTKLHWQGVQAAAKEHGYPCSYHNVSLQMDEGPKEWTKFVSSVKKFQSSWEAPIGITVVGDETARSLVSILTYLGWKIPEEAAIVAAGKNELVCNSIHPTLSTINFAYQQGGYHAAELLDRLLKGEEVEKEGHMYACKELVVGETSDVYAVDDPYVANALEYISNNSNSFIISNCCICLPDLII